MKTFLLDLWYDLREKRLWPVAVILAVALAAVPLVLRKSAEEPAAPAATAAPATAADAEAEELAVKALQEGSVPSSKLDTFSAKNPFRPLVKERSVESLASQLDSSADAPSGGAPSGGGDAGGGSVDGGAPSTGGDVGGVDPAPAPDPGGDTPDQTTTKFTYAVDLTFTSNDRTRRIKGMERLDMLPSASNPLLLFLGVSDDAGNAVFLVDSTLSAAGEGSCQPTPEECAFVHVGPGSEHQFTTEEGDSYTLRVDEIRKVKVSTKSKKAGASKRPKASAAVGKPVRRRFVPPVLADLVVVATGAAGDSNSGSDRR
jgi:hypothetical protein